MVNAVFLGLLTMYTHNEVAEQSLRRYSCSSRIILTCLRYRKGKLRQVQSVEEYGFHSFICCGLDIRSAICAPELLANKFYFTVPTRLLLSVSGRRGNVISGNSPVKPLRNATMASTSSLFNSLFS